MAAFEKNLSWWELTLVQFGPRIRFTLNRFLLNHKRSTEMHPEQIKAEMRMQGTTPAALADSLGLSPQTVSNVIHARTKSSRVASAISKLIKKPVASIWPVQYGPTKKRSLKRSVQ